MHEKQLCSFSPSPAASIERDEEKRMSLLWPVEQDMSLSWCPIFSSSWGQLSDASKGELSSD